MPIAIPDITILLAFGDIGGDGGDGGGGGGGVDGWNRSVNIRHKTQGFGTCLV